MIQHLLEKSKITLFLFTIFLSCNDKKDNIRTDTYVRLTISDSLKKQISFYKDDLTRMQATESNNISINIMEKKDSLLIEMGDYQPDLQTVDVNGIDIIKKDTIYIYGNKELANIKGLYEGVRNEKIDIVQNLTPNFSYNDPHYRCLCFYKGNFSVLSYNNKCR